MNGCVQACFSATFAAAALLSAGCGRRGPEAPAPAAARTNDVLVLVTTTDTPPYSYRDEETGAAASLGCRLETRQAKFTDLLVMVSSGEADIAVSGITITEGRRQAVDFSIPYATEGGMFLYRAADPMPTMITAEKMRVGTMDASTYDYYLTSHGIDPIRYDSYVNALADLRARTLDALFFDSCAVRLEAEKSKGELAASRLETRENFGIAVRKGNVRLKKALDAVISSRARKRRRR